MFKIIIFLISIACLVSALEETSSKTKCSDFINYSNTIYNNQSNLVKVFPLSVSLKEIRYLNITVSYDEVKEKAPIVNFLNKENPREIIENIVNQKPIPVSIEYDGNKPPKVNEIFFNGKSICERENDSPSSTFEEIFQISEEDIAIFLENFPLEVNTNCCGISPLNNESAASGWDNILWQDWPWTTKIYANTSYICTGNLISKNVILTAADCLHDDDDNLISYKDIRVVLSNNENSNQEIWTYKVHKLHDKHKNDLALLYLVQNADDVTPLCLATETSPPSSCSLITFGSTIKGTAGSFQRVKMDTIDGSTCRASNDSLATILEDYHFCADTPNLSGVPCAGDTGAGLLDQINDKWTLVGVLSTGLMNKHAENSDSCGREGYAIFTNTAHFVSWISNNSSKNVSVDQKLGFEDEILKTEKEEIKKKVNAIKISIEKEQDTAKVENNVRNNDEKDEEKEAFEKYKNKLCSACQEAKKANIDCGINKYNFNFYLNR